MLTLELWWAGRLIGTEEVKPKWLAARLDELRGEVEKGTLTHSACGTCFVVAELCVDVYGLFGDIAFYSFKKS